MKIDIVTLFPEMFKALDYGITGRAIKNQQIILNCYNPRDYTKDKHGNVDDRSYGGGPGMVMAIQPLQDAIHAAKRTQTTDCPATSILLSPQGRRLEQDLLPKLAQLPHILLVLGRYEGIDERLIKLEIDETLSIGDYILSGGELAAMVLIDALARLLPGVVGDAKSTQEDSFTTGLLDWPHYTRPEIYAGQRVPDVLLSGDHRAVARWRLKQALGRTWQRRPDLFEKRRLTKEEQQLLQEFMTEEKDNE